MIDVEFVSELVIALVHGLQNKKDNLDDWYRSYEKEFPRRADVESVMPTTLGELLAILPDVGRTRWRKKSDFYTLFLVLARHNHLFPLSREGRKATQENLVAFGQTVDQFVGDREAPHITQSAKNYALAVERAASDLANRKERDLRISELLKKIFEAERRAAAEAQDARG
jgi:hypothetical protein